MVSLADVGVLPADVGQASGKFGVNKSTTDGDKPTRNPCAQDEHGRVHGARHHVGIHENAGADDAAHDDHGGVEQAQLARQRGAGGHEG